MKTLYIIAGANGSGKTTFLRILAGLENSCGNIIVEDKVWQSDKYFLSPQKREIGFVFQDYALTPELTLYENIALPMMALGKSKKSYDKDVQEIIKRVGLAGRENNLPSELSGGEQQRVSIARAIVNKPEILFADEPAANLDSESAKTVLEVMRELVDKYNQTIILVTHEPDDKKYVDRVVWLKDGKLQPEK